MSDILAYNLNMNPMEVVKTESARLSQEVKEKTLGYILTALGLVAGLAWNEAIKSIIDSVFPSEKGTLMAQLIYAVAITVVVVVVATYLTRYIQKKEGN